MQALAVRMCPECGVGFEPRASNQVYCCSAHGNKHRFALWYKSHRESVIKRVGLRREAKRLDSDRR